MASVTYEDTEVADATQSLARVLALSAALDSAIAAAMEHDFEVLDAVAGFDGDPLIDAMIWLSESIGRAGLAAEVPGAVNQAAALMNVTVE